MRPFPGLASTPAPPYYAVVFTSARSPRDTSARSARDTSHAHAPSDDGYAAMADAMEALAAKQPGYLGIESARGADGVGITVSYWASLDAITAWKKNAEHVVAQQLGRERFYAAYELRVCKVERAYGHRR